MKTVIAFSGRKQVLCHILTILILLLATNAAATSSSSNTLQCVNLRAEQTDTLVRCLYNAKTRKKSQKCIKSFRQNINKMSKRHPKHFTNMGKGTKESGCSQTFSIPKVVQVVNNVCKRDDDLNKQDCMKLVQFYVGLKVTQEKKEDDEAILPPPQCSQGQYSTTCIDGIYACCDVCGPCDCDECITTKPPPTTTTMTTTEPPITDPPPPPLVEYDRIVDLSYENEDFPYPESRGYGRRVSLGGVEAFRLAVSPRYHAVSTGDTALDDSIRTTHPLAMVFQEEGNSVWLDMKAPLYVQDGQLPVAKDDIGNIAVLSRLESNLMLVRYNRGVEVGDKVVDVGALQAYIYDSDNGWEEHGDFLGGVDISESIAGIALADEGPYFIAEYRDLSTQEDAIGKVLVHSIDEDGNIEQVGTEIRGTVGKHSDFDLGSSVGISSDGTMVAVGFQILGEECNAVTVYELSEENIWIQTAPSIEFEEEYCTGVLTLELHTDGKYIAIGSTYEDGLVQIFGFDGEVWNPRGELYGDEGMNSSFGKSLSMDEKGDRIIVGAPDHSGPDGVMELAGQVQIYQYIDEVWQKRAVMYGEEDFQRFGFSVSMDLAGYRVAVGSLGTGNGGRVEVYQYP